MHDVDWAHVKDVLSRALDHPRDQREAFLLEATDNEAVRQEVRELLDIELTAGDFLETPAAALVGPMALSSDRIGPFQLLECLGEGGMGIVYRALRADGQYEQEVAVKIIRRAYLDPDHLLRFRAERQILARLAHPGIARLIDGGRTPDGLSFIAMEYVAGDRIDTYCDLHKLSLDARIRLFLQVCEAVDYAHRNLVVHRDLKPSNILVSPDATGGHVVKLLDFGIAKLLDPAPGDPTLTATGNRLMTPEYAAPEQVTGGPISTATDTYALGVLLYRLLTGCRPYQSGLDVAAVEYAVQHEEPQRPSAAASRRVEAAPVDERAANRSSTADRLRRQLRGDLDNILLKALRKEPEHRYASVDRLTSDLQRYLANEPVEARQPTLAYRAGKFIRRHRAGVSAAVFSFTVVAVAAGLLYAQTHRIAQERDRAERAFEFVVGTFDVLDPETTGQGRLAEAATQMVEAGVEQADIEFAGRPAEQARLFGVLGDLYHKLGRYPEAVAQHARALVLHRETEASAVDEHRALVRLAAAHIGAGRYLTADSLLSLAETFDVPASEAALRQLEQVEILLEKGLYEEATALASGTLFEHAALTQEDDLRLEFLRAGIAADAGRTAAAESLYSLVQERSANLNISGKPYRSRAITGLATVYADMGRLAEAESLYVLAIETRKEALGARHPSLATLWNNYGTVLSTVGRDQEADSLYALAIRLLQEQGEEEGRTYAAVANSLADRYEAQGKLDSAQVWFEASAKAYVNSGAEEHVQLAQTLFSLAQLHWSKDELSRAIELAERSLKIHSLNPGLEEAIHARSLVILAMMKLESQDYRSAMSHVDSALKMRARLYAPGAYQFGPPHIFAGEALLGMGDTLAAEKRIRLGSDVIKSSHGRDHWLVAYADSVLTAISNPQVLP